MSPDNTELNFNGYDFIDFGCSKGGSLEFGATAFGGRGVGLDIDADKVDLARKLGFEAYQADVSKIDPDLHGKVRFAIMSHFLEHLPGVREANACINSAARMTNEFFLIQQPYFDADGYLFENGLKLYWSDWHGHTYHMSILQLWRILQNLLSKGKISRFIIGRRHPIANSHSKEVHSLSSAVDQIDWDPSLHEERPLIEFSVPVYRELCAIGLHNHTVLDPKLQRYLRRSNIVFDSGHYL